MDKKKPKVSLFFARYCRKKLESINEYVRVEARAIEQEVEFQSNLNVKRKAVSWH